MIRALSLLASVLLAGYAIYDAFQPKAAFAGVPPFPHYDKVVHFCAYFAMATLMSYGLALFGRFRPRLRRKSGVAWVWAIVTAIGALCEVAQWYMGQGRVGDPLDVAANSLGAFAACLLFLWIQSVEYADSH